MPSSDRRRRRLRRTATSTSTSYSRRSVYVFDPTAANTRSRASRRSPSRPASPSDSSGNVYVVNGGGEAAPKGTTEIYSATGEPRRAARREPLLRRGGRSDRRPRLRGRRQPGHRVRLRRGTGRGPDRRRACSRTRSASPRTPARSRSPIPAQANVATFGPRPCPPTPSTDNPLVVDSVSSPERCEPADFQVTPSGNYAAFTSTLPLTGYDNGGPSEIFRYDAPTGELDCASCNPTAEQATADATLPANGLGLTRRRPRLLQLHRRPGRPGPQRKGRRLRVGAGGLRIRPRRCACEVAAGCVQLISTGASPFRLEPARRQRRRHRRLLLHPRHAGRQDENGSTVKIYDAREHGGFSVFPAADPVQGLRRVPRAGHASAAAAR